MNSYFVNPAYCYRGGGGPVADRPGAHCLASPADQLHPAGIDYPPPQLLRAHYDDVYGGYAASYAGYPSLATDKAAQHNGSVGAYYADLDANAHHLGSFSTSGQQLPLIDATPGIGFQSRNSAPSPMPAPLDFCRPYMPPDGPSAYQTGSKNGGHLVSPPFAAAGAAEVQQHQVVTTQTKPEHASTITSGSAPNRRHVESGRSDCSRSPSGSSSRSSSPGSSTVEPGQGADCRRPVEAPEADGVAAAETMETAVSGTGSCSTFAGASNSSGRTTTTTTSEFQQQIYPWMRRIHLANGRYTCNIIQRSVMPPKFSTHCGFLTISRYTNSRG